MKRGIRFFAACIALGALGFSLLAQSTNYSLWINGRTGGGQIGNYNDFTYWGPSSTAPNK